MKINCPEHGVEFEGLDGCPQCIEEAKVNSQASIAERIEAVQPQPNIVKVKYFSDTDGPLSDREYSYFSEIPLALYDKVMVPVRGRDQKAIVTAINVLEEEIEEFRDKVKTIPSGSRIVGLAAAAETAGAGVTVAEVDGTLASVEQGTLSDEEEARIMAEGEPEAGIISYNYDSDLAVKSLVEEANRFLEYARSRVVNDPGSEKKASEDLNLIRNTKKAIGAKRKEYLDPVNAKAAEIRGFFKQLEDPIEEADELTSGQMLSYSAEVTRQREEAERLQAESLQLAKDQENLSGEHTVSLAEIPKPEEAKKRIRTDLGLTSKVDHWKWKVVDTNAIPREYLIPDEAMLNSIAKKHHDGKQIPGIEFYNEPHMASRSIWI